jgi:hypothetical protein
LAALAKRKAPLLPVADIRATPLELCDFQIAPYPKHIIKALG